MTDFELVDVSLYSDELGRVEVPLRDPAGAEPLDVPEGAVVSVGLTFRLGREIDGLVFEDTRSKDDVVLAATRTVLGGFRPGGPYEVRLPPERLPVGRAHCGVYDVAGRFTDGDGRELAVEHHRLSLTHQPAAHKRWVVTPTPPTPGPSPATGPTTSPGRDPTLPGGSQAA
ncbi:hypothetical protein ACIGO8_30595 [Streptomyces sp. NPDC053493]|uniref:hypothetical protein n=1 Tax=Streptomyces sp. NPDC053493 TaxID=3365705 RepID=UPI0037D8DDE5